MPQSLMQKLRLQPGHRARILNAPAGAVDVLGPLPDGARWIGPSSDQADFVLLFVASLAELESLGPQAIAAVRPDGLLWIAYPKRSSGIETDISRDVGWDLLARSGLRPVTQIAIDETWSALRFRPADLVGKG